MRKKLQLKPQTQVVAFGVYELEILQSFYKFPREAQSMFLKILH